MRRHALRRGGFTLFEVLGVVFVTTLVLGFATDYYIDLSRATHRAAENTRDIRHATALLDRIARDFESTLLIVKPAELDPLAHPWLFVAESQYGESGADHLKFVTTNFQPRRSQEHESDVTLVAYMLRRSEDDDSFELFRWTAPQLPESLDRSFPSEDDEASVLLAEGLADFGVMFYGEEDEEGDTWDSTTLVQSSSLPASVEITVAIADPEAGFDADEAVRYRRRVLLPLRPLDLEQLIELAGTEANAEEDEADGEESEGDGPTFASCFDLSALGAAAQDVEPAFEGFARASGGRQWAEVKDMIPDDLWIFVLPKPECQ
jgi:hypothetical protein